MVAYYITKALANQMTVTYFPSYVPRSYTVNLFKVYSRLARRDFEILQWVDHI